MSFQSLGLSKALLKAIHNQGYNSPSPIQEKAIPLILKGKDVLASAQTGTGKNSWFYFANVTTIISRTVPKKEGRLEL